jgi:hypothetical protein
MIRLWLTFIVLAVLIHFVITTVRKFDGKERWDLTKSIGYSIIVSMLTLALIVGLVILF